METLFRPDAPRWQRVLLAVCMFLITAAMGFIQPFMPLYLEASGLKRAQIGLVTGLGAGLALLVQPLIGQLSDRLDARRPFMVAAAILAGFAYWNYRTAHGLTAFLVLTALGANGTIYLNAVGGVLVGRMVTDRARAGAAYAGYRVWGSVGYILVSLLTGWLLSRTLHPHSVLNRAALDPVFTYGPLLFVAIAVVACFVPDKKNAPAPVRESASTPMSMVKSTTSEAESGVTAGVLSAESAEADRTPSPRAPNVSGPEQSAELSRNLRAFLLAYFLYSFALYGASAYLSLYLKALGAAPLAITATFAVGVVCEVCVMTRVGRFSDTFGRWPALAVAFILLPIRLLLYVPATGPLWIAIVQTLHGFNFGIMGAVAIVFVNDTARQHERGVAQARLAGVGGLATAISPAVCGWIAQKASIGWMFAAISAVGACGTAIYLTQVRESHPAPRSLAELTAQTPALLRPLVRLLAYSR